MPGVWPGAWSAPVTCAKALNFLFRRSATELQRQAKTVQHVVNVAAKRER